MVSAPPPPAPPPGRPAAPAPGELFIPAGSILTGVLLNGLDAPTGQGARQQPPPALVRIKHDALLPNRFRADVKECFVIVGGFGDLGSERAYLRAETLTCVRTDGGVIEVPLDAYAVGEDGKVGIRGRLVSAVVGQASAWIASPPPGPSAYLVEEHAAVDGLPLYPDSDDLLGANADHSRSSSPTCARTSTPRPSGWGARHQTSCRRYAASTRGFGPR